MMGHWEGEVRLRADGAYDWRLTRDGTTYSVGVAFTEKAALKDMRRIKATTEAIEGYGVKKVTV